MIYTVTFNPALDYYLTVSHFSNGDVNRSQGEEMQVGGKGINVSLVLKELGQPSTALGFVAGFVGTEIQRRLEEKGVHTDFIRLSEGCSRINVKLRGAKETDINADGPAIEAQAFVALMEKLSALQGEDTLVLAGSVPAGLPRDIYCRILKALSHKNIRFVVDATGELLTAVLPFRPFLIKPNHHELGEIFGKTLCSEEEIITCARVLQQQGARNVLVSMAGDGALLLDETGALHRIAAPAGEVKGSVGAGDSMVAGFLVGFAQSGNYQTALAWGTAAGSATAFSKGLATKQEIDGVLHSLKQIKGE